MVLLKQQHIQSNTSNVDEIWAVCEDIVALDPENVREISSGPRSMKYEVCVPVVRLIVQFYGRMTRDTIEVLPENHRRTVAQQLSATQNLFFRMQGLEYQDPEDARRSLEEHFVGVRKELSHLMPHETLDEAELRNRIEQIEGELTTTVERVREKEREVDDVLSAAKEAAADTGVADHTQVFAGAAENYERAKKRWLSRLVRVSVATLVVAVVWIVIELIWPAATPALAIQLAAAKLFLFGVLSYLIVFTSRSYRAAAHNQIVNEHRRDALKTFRAFPKAAWDATTKDVILMQTTQCIFAHRPSGFGQQESDATLPPQAWGLGSMMEAAAPKKGAGE